MAKFKVGDKVAYYGKEPAIYRQRGTVSDVSQIRGETFVTVDLDNGEEWGAPEKDWTFMNSCARNAIKVGDTVTYKLDAPGNKGKKYIVLEEGRTGYVWLADMDGRGNGMEVKRADLVAANSCRSTNAIVAKALNACGTARNAFSVTQGDVNRMCNEGLQAGKKLIQHINEWMATIRDYQRNPNLQDKYAEDEYEGTKGLVDGFKEALRAMGW